MIPTWSVIRAELAREKAVAQRLIAQGYKVAELIEVRLIRHSRRAKRRHITEVNVLPGKVIALVPDMDLDQMGDIPHVLGISRHRDGAPWQISENEVNEFSENLRRINEITLQNMQKKPNKQKRKWESLRDGLRRYAQTDIG